jgi:ABC-type nitrate/sulfonate/bicarbonate transport system substrate-binding protein
MRTLAAVSCEVSPVLISAAACATPQVTERPDEVAVQLAWVHQYQFAGFCTTDRQGFYAAEGLQVTLLSRPEVTADGLADFGVNFGAGPLMDHSRGLPVTAIPAVYRLYPLVFMTMPDSGITRPCKHDPALDAAQRAAMMNASARVLHAREDDISWMRSEVCQGTYDTLCEQPLCYVREACMMDSMRAICGEEP